MSLLQPTTAEIKADIIAQLESKLGESIPLLPKSFSRVLATVLAGALVILYKYGGFMFLQMFPAYASTEETTVNGQKLIPLVEWGRLTGVGDPTPATRAEYTITLTVITASGTIAANTHLYSAKNNVTYMTLAVVDLTDPAPVQVDIRAVNDAYGNEGRGVQGNLEVSDKVTFLTPVANVAVDAVVATELVTGVDQEDWTDYRRRVIDRFRMIPQGGAYTDYRGWGLLASGIINVYVYTGDPGEVDVYSEANTDTDPDGIPTSAQLTAVKTAIEYTISGVASRRPVNSYVNSLPITRTGFTVTVTGLAVPGILQDVKDKIEESLELYFWGREPYINGLSVGPRKDRLTIAAVGGVIQDVVAAYGGVYTAAAFQVTGGMSYEVYVLGEGEKAKLSAMVWS